MQLYSTKNKEHKVSLETAVFKGLPPDNGLYMPESIPVLPPSFYDKIDTLSFQEIAFEVSKALIGKDVPDADLKNIINDVLNFDAPIVKIEDGVYVLELFHGPTLAFKDFGARFMARLMSYFLQKEKKEIHILVATSGDTGSAVAYGFYKTPGIKVTILYPSGKVSMLQEKQLTTLGENVTALEVDGTFDDCQKLVKVAFLDKTLNESLNLSSANSINISRLIPQSFYYFYAYAQAKKAGLSNIVFCTPSGNFGNLTAGLIAKRMGLPIKHFIAATNSNAIVPDYINTGKYNPKPSVQTISNAMDVGNPSNFARMEYMYQNEVDNFKKEIDAYAFTDAQTKEAMKSVFDKTGYVMCPHTAVGYLGLKAYQSKDNNCTGIFLSTAHPAKFIDIVEETIGKKIEVPARLQEVADKPKKSILLNNSFESLKKYLTTK